MHKSTSSRTRRFSIMAVLSAGIAASTAAALLIGGVSPAMAANIAHQADTQVAVFMVPLTLLILALLIEATRFAWRGTLPARHSAGRLRDPLSLPRVQ